VYGFDDRILQLKLGAVKSKTAASFGSVDEQFKMLNDRMTAVVKSNEALSKKNEGLVKALKSKTSENNNLEKVQTSMSAQIATKDSQIEVLKADLDSSDATARAEKARADEAQSFMASVISNLGKNRVRIGRSRLTSILQTHTTPASTQSKASTLGSRNFNHLSPTCKSQ
jgi:hypothetical protein